MLKSKYLDINKNKKTINKNRIVAEEYFHDKMSEKINLEQINYKLNFMASTALENKIIWDEIKKKSKASVLDLGCGWGETAIFFAKEGYDVVASDISQKMLNILSELAKKEQVDISVVKASTDNLPFEDNSFDFVYCNGVLHHVDIPLTLNEIKRVLKPSGKAFFIEPLAYNPIIRIYRKIAGEIRSKDEKPISINDIKFIKKSFSYFDSYYTWFFSLFIFIKMFLFERLNPSKIMYWKHVLKEEKKYSREIKILSKLDEIFLKFFPFMKIFCWNIVMVVKK